MELRCDIAILGCGVAAMGALQRIQGSFDGSVCVIGENASASMYSNGAWDPKLLDPRLVAVKEEGSRKKVDTREQQTPDGVKQDWQSFVLQAFPDLLGATEEEAWLADGWGRIFSSTVAQHTHLPGNLKPYLQSEAAQSTIGLLQFGDASISPYPAKEYNEKYSPKRELFFDIHIPISLTNSSPFVVGQRLLQEKEFLSSVLDQLKKKTKRCDLLLCPPIFGVEEAQDRWKTFAKALRCQVGELLSTHPSPAGLRLHHTLSNKFKALPYQRLEGSVEGAMLKSGTIQSLKVRRQGKKKEALIKPRQVLLCTGDAASGGIIVNGNGSGPVERIFQIPAQEDTTKSPWDLSHGICVNHSCQPIDTYDHIIADNLFACGHVVYHWPPSIYENALLQQDNLMKIQQPIPKRSLADAYQQGYLAAGFVVQSAASKTREFVS